MRTNTLWFMVGTVATLTLVVALGGCNGMGQGDDVYGTRPTSAEQVNLVRVRATDFEFTPSTITVEPGEMVEVQLVNEGSAEHNIEFELPEGEMELDRNVRSGDVGALRFTAPYETGRYTFYCPVNDHLERGMIGTLVVRERMTR